MITRFKQRIGAIPNGYKLAGIAIVTVAGIVQMLIVTGVIVTGG